MVVKLKLKVLLRFQSLPENYRKPKTNKQKYGFSSFFDEFEKEIDSIFNQNRPRLKAIRANER